MSTHPARVYGAGLIGASAGGRLHAHYDDGRIAELPLVRWLGQPDTADESMLARCGDPTLDVGCGPGRLISALTTRDVPALGLDIAAPAVRLCRSRGLRVLARSVFDEVPDEGSWRTVLLADGNVGIGGDPVVLLQRCRDLLSPDGEIVVELDPPETTSEPVRLSLHGDDDHRSSWFDWAHVSAADIDTVAAVCDLTVIDRWTVSDRWFAACSHAGF